MAGEHYDVVIVGSGPGGGTMAWRLAQTGKRILLVERGDYLPRRPRNWDSQSVIVDGVYQAKETWYASNRKSFHPGLHSFVGGSLHAPANRSPIAFSTCRARTRRGTNLVITAPCGWPRPR